MNIYTYRVRWIPEDRYPITDREAADAEYRTLPKRLDATDDDFASLGDDEGLWDMLKKNTGFGYDTPRYWRGYCFYRQYL